MKQLNSKTAKRLKEMYKEPALCLERLEIIGFKNELKEINNNNNLNLFQKMVKTREVLDEIEQVENEK